MGQFFQEITILHFDDTYSYQKKLQKLPHENIYFQHLKGVNLYCEKQAYSKIKEILSQRRNRGITLIGNGNYHYISYILLQEIKHPVTLVLFDNHTDLSRENNFSLLSCGTWVSYALKTINLLEKVVIIGPTSAKTYPSIPQVTIFPFNTNHHYSMKSILSTIHTNNVYISIDKDVLNRDTVITNWDQGKMNLETLVQMIEKLFQTKEIVGIDICGEEKISPGHSILPEYRKIIKKNEEVNLQILNTCLKHTHSTVKQA